MKFDVIEWGLYDYFALVIDIRYWILDTRKRKVGYKSRIDYQVSPPACEAGTGRQDRVSF